MHKSHNHTINLRVCPYLRSWSFLLSLEQSKERNVGDLHNLEPYTGNITDSMTLTSETRHQHLVVLFYVVQTTVIGYESCDLLTVLDELHSHTFTDGRVGLFRFHTDLLEDDSLCVGSSTKRVGFQCRTEMGFLVAEVVPPLFTSKRAEFSGNSDTTWLTHFELD